MPITPIPTRCVPRSRPLASWVAPARADTPGPSWVTCSNSARCPRRNTSNLGVSGGLRHGVLVADRHRSPCRGSLVGAAIDAGLTGRKGGDCNQQAEGDPEGSPRSRARRRGPGQSVPWPSLGHRGRGDPALRICSGLLVRRRSPAVEDHRSGGGRSCCSARCWAPGWRFACWSGRAMAN